MKPPSPTVATPGTAALMLDDKSISLAQTTAVRYGEPRFINGRGQIVVNPQFWAAFFVAQSGLEYSSRRNTFILVDPETEQPRHVDETHVRDLLRTFLCEIARTDRYHYLVPLLSPPRLDRLLKAVKMVASRNEPDEVTSLDTFLTERLERHHGSSITTREVFVAYQDYCTKHDLPPMPEKVFFDHLAKRVRDKFSVVRHHDIQREDKAQKGFMHLRLQGLRPDRLD